MKLATPDGDNFQVALLLLYPSSKCFYPELPPVQDDWTAACSFGPTTVVGPPTGFDMEVSLAVSALDSCYS